MFITALLHFLFKWFLSKDENLEDSRFGTSANEKGVLNPSLPIEYNSEHALSILGLI